MSPQPRPYLRPEEIAALVEARVSEPHTWLGMHPVPGQGVVVRALRPDAAAVSLVDEADGTATPLERRHADGLFELHLPDRPAVFAYRLRMELADGRSVTVPDPYTFLPTLGEIDQLLAGEGRHEELYRKLGAHVETLGGVPGTRFAVWAPNAARVSVVGDWNGWDGRIHMMRRLGATGIWELFIPGLGPGDHYRYELRRSTGAVDLRSDPVGFGFELRPKVASRIVDLDAYTWQDDAWMERRRAGKPLEGPLAIYEVHLGSWMRREDGTWLTYGELAERLVPYVQELGFTHVELMPVMEHPFDGSWGYQVTGYFAPTRRFGEPAEFMAFVDRLHRAGIGVYLDWVPAHFPRDEFALARFDGTALYEHADPRQGEHPDWDTFIFNYGRHEVRNFLVANAVFWLDVYHVDGLRVDAVASMLYLDYSREPGEWVPNRHGGRENLDAIAFLRELNEVVHRRCPGALMVAEESTSWPGGVSHTAESGGLGFDAMWNMGFMHDMLAYFHEDPLFRVHHQEKLTFSLLYAFTERFVLPFSHDEVVHGKASMVAKMPGDEWRKFANLRALYTLMFAHPGKKLLFMGNEFGPWTEWAHDRSLDWDLLRFDTHRGLRDLVCELGRLYREHRALWEIDDHWEGFQWIDFTDAPRNIVSWIRRGHAPGDRLVCAFNLSPVPHPAYRVGAPRAGRYRVVLNGDERRFHGSGFGPLPGAELEWHSDETQGQPGYVSLDLPPLAGVWLAPIDGESA